MKYKNPYLYDRDTIEHGWATKAEERAYNREYYQKHKEELLRKAREAREGIQRTAQNVSDYGQKLANDYRTSREMRKHVDKERTIDTAGKYGRKFLNNLADFQRRHGASNEDIEDTRQLGRDYTRLRSGTSQAINEADKLARQNSPVERVKRDLRRTTAGTHANVENAFNNARSAVEDAGRYLEKTYKDAQTRSQQRKQAKGYKLASDLLSIPDRIVNKMYPDRNELNEVYRNNPEARENRNKLNRYRRQYGTAANEAAKASMTRAQKEALKKREEAKRRMQKWFKR